MYTLCNEEALLVEFRAWLRSRESWGGRAVRPVHLGLWPVDRLGDPSQKALATVGRWQERRGRG